MDPLEGLPPPDDLSRIKQPILRKGTCLPIALDKSPLPRDLVAVMKHIPDIVVYDVAAKLNALARHLGALARHGRGWTHDGSAGAFTRLMRIAMSYIAMADGPLTAEEQRIIRILFPSRNLRRDTTGSLVARTMDPPAVERVVQSLGSYMCANAKQSVDYRSETDPVVGLMQEAGTMICACDEGTAVSEMSRLTDVISALRAQAQQAEQSCSTLLLDLGMPDTLTERDAKNCSAPSIPKPFSLYADPQPVAGLQNHETVRSETKHGHESGHAMPTVMPSPLSELHALVGLGQVKHEVETLTNVARVMQLRRSRGMTVPKLGYHLVFTGNPGTGKTTVARILAAIYGQLGIVRLGHLVEVDRSGLVGGYLGQTAIKVQEVVQSALGGILFIDEAYSLAGRDQDSYGAEAIETLLKSMEDHRDDFILIVAGYPAPMEKFLISNPGLQSRFSRKIHFPDYTASEMKEIFCEMALRDGFTLAATAEDALDAVLDLRCRLRSSDFANARDVRNLYEQSIGEQANRLQTDLWITDQDLRVLTANDISASGHIFSESAIKASETSE